MDEHLPQIDFVALEGRRLKVEGGVWLADADGGGCCDASTLSLVCSAPGSSAKARVTFTGERICKKVKIAGSKQSAEYRRFACAVQLPEAGECTVSWERGGAALSWRSFRHGWYSPFSERIGAGYFVAEGLLVELRGGVLRVRRHCAWRHCLAEIRFCVRLLAKPSADAYQAFAARMMVPACRRMMRRPLWLCSDRFNKADDNGRAFFEFLNSGDMKGHGPDSVFAVESTCSDYSELKGVGRVVNASGWRYKLTFLTADYVISAYHTKAQRMPFSERSIAYLKPYCLRPRFVYLRHGISMNDVSKTVGRQFDNARIMISSAPREYQSVLDGAYGYTERELKLCGLTRYDKLYDDRKGKVTIMPTWRKSLARRVGAYEFRLSRDFGESPFCQAYRSLLSHPLVVGACRRRGLTLQVMLHPNIAGAHRFFEDIPGVEVLPLTESYRKIFAETDLMVTDYSSVAFDFAYLKKPVLYFQFDQADFFGGQYGHGYYDYAKDGFGEVETELDAMAGRIAEYIDGGCRMKPEYQKRVDSFFAFSDKGSCRRVYEAMLEADREDGVSP
ncbi:MAG: CDP-glycerol glycerophosphotransferase family protein [Kiritimatiellae bacterium]|nr:CDP-glycerol glycerophosphotransferase family protein [Kiritimatiellia bacterium]